MHFLIVYIGIKGISWYIIYIYASDFSNDHQTSQKLCDDPHVI